jgi:hypothetical protein
MLRQIGPLSAVVETRQLRLIIGLFSLTVRAPLWKVVCQAHFAFAVSMHLTLVACYCGVCRAHSLLFV